MKKIQIKVVNKGNQQLPEYKTPLSSGMDIRADIDSPVTIQPLERMLLPTGLYVAIPDGYEAQVRPRSGLALKKGITIINTPGTIDADYRNAIGVVLINLSNEPFTINPGDRIAQLVIAPVVQGEWVEVETLDKTERDGGFGRTGIK